MNNAKCNRNTRSSFWDEIRGQSSVTSKCSMLVTCSVGGVVISVLAAGPKSRRFKPGRCVGFKGL
jgi:hypothetical protein